LNISAKCHQNRSV